MSKTLNTTRPPSKRRQIVPIDGGFRLIWWVSRYGDMLCDDFDTREQAEAALSEQASEDRDAEHAQLLENAAEGWAP